MIYREAYPESLTNGIGLISQLATIESIPWSGHDTESIKSIERAYNVHSGFKTLIDSFLAIPENNRAALIAAMYKSKWDKLWELFSLSYNPLDAYRMVEKRDTTHGVESTRKSIYGKEVDSVVNDAGTITEAGENTGDGNTGVYGFNSVSAVPKNTETNRTTSSNNQTRDLDTTSHISNSGTDTYTGNSQDTEKIESSKEGNIGYTTPQELIRQDMELWAVPFFNLIFADIDDFIMLQVYSL